jgi:hypothetical protein
MRANCDGERAALAAGPVNPDGSRNTESPSISCHRITRFRGTSLKSKARSAASWRAWRRLDVEEDLREGGDGAGSVGEEAA